MDVQMPGLDMTTSSVRNIEWFLMPDLSQVRLNLALMAFLIATVGDVEEVGIFTLQKLCGRQRNLAPQLEANPFEAHSSYLSFLLKWASQSSLRTQSMLLHNTQTPLYLEVIPQIFRVDHDKVPTSSYQKVSKIVAAPTEFGLRWSVLQAVVDVQLPAWLDCWMMLWFPLSRTPWFLQRIAHAHIMLLPLQHPLAGWPHWLMFPFVSISSPLN